MSSVPDTWIAAALAGDDPGPLPDGTDFLSLDGYGTPDLRHAELETLAPLLARPELGQVHGLSMAESACESLAAVLAAVGPLTRLSLSPTEAYSTATDGGTFPAIAASPSAHSLTTLRIEYTWISNLSALTESPLRSLETLSLIGDLRASDLDVLGRPAPALRSVRHLTLSVDGFNEEVARKMAASPDLAALETLSLAFVCGVGFDWGGAYRESDFINNFPAALAALQQLPGLKEIILCDPYGSDDLEFDAAMWLAVFERLTDATPVRLEDRMAPEIRSWLRQGWEEGWGDLWGVDPGSRPPTAHWVQGLHDRGALTALGLPDASPRDSDRGLFDETAEELREGEEDIFLDSLIARWGRDTVAAELTARCGPVSLTQNSDGEWILKMA